MKIDLLEELALGEDRRAAVDKLVQGTAEHAYWTAIHRQFAGELDEVDAMLARWDHREAGANELRRQLETRQLLLKAGASIESVYEPLLRATRASLHAQRESSDESSPLPSRIDAEINLDAEIERLLRERPDELDAFTPWADDMLVARHEALTPEQRARLVDRLTHSAHPALVALIAADSAHRERRTPNQALIDSLTLEQLLALAPLSRFASEHEIVRWIAARLCPSAFEHEDHPAVRGPWIARWMALLAQFNEGFYSVKARVWLAWLDDERAQGRYDRAQLEALLSLPLQRPYINPTRLSDARGAAIAQPETQYGPDVRLPSARASAAEIVRDYVEHFARRDELGSLEPLLNSAWLDPVRAQVELCSGRGDASRWITRLGAAWVSDVRDAVWLQFSPQNPVHYASSAPVELDLWIKNVPELTIKVFELDLRSYFASTGRAPASDINLDGMIARHERTLRFERSPIVAHRAQIALPECDRPGTYVIELIGNGRAARAFVRKGSLRARAIPSAAGLSVSVFDEHGALVTDATIRRGERVFSAREDGIITLPFSTHASSAGAPALIERGPLATVLALDAPIERYELSLTADAEPQALLAQRKAKVVVTARLTCNGEPVSLALLQDATLSAHGSHGDESIAVIESPVALRDDRSCELELRVPEGVASLSITLRASLRRASDGALERFACSASLAMNTIHRTMERSEPHLARTPAGFVLELLGKNGEPLAHHRCVVALAHRALTEEQRFERQTDERGRIELGPLAGYHHLHLTLGDGRARAWRLDAPTPLRSLSITEGESITLPYASSAALAGAALQLVELAPLPARDWTAQCHLEPGALRIDALAPGEYRLHVGPDAQCSIFVAPRVVTERASELFASGPRTLLERRPPRPFVRAAHVHEGSLHVHVEHASSDCRLIVIGTRWCAADAIASAATALRAPSVTIDAPPVSERHSNRTLSDEHRYVIERKRSKRRAGLLLDKPSLLANPWARGATVTHNESLAHESDEVYKSMAPSMRAVSRAGGGRYQQHAVEPEAPSYDFLASPATVIANGSLDAQGRATIALDALGDAQSASIIVEDGAARHQLELPLAARPLLTRELRLSNALDRARPAIEQRTLAAAPRATTVALDDVRSSNLALLDTVSSLWRTLSAIAPSATPSEWSWIAEWATFDRAKKRALYSEFACHELHLFLWSKDRPFFEDTVRIHLQNKRHKDFMDRALLGEDLARYVDLWSLSRLNAIERALLARLHPPSREPLARWFADAIELSPPDPTREQHLLEQILRAGGLAGGAFSDAKDALAQQPAAMSEAAAAMPAPEASYDEEESEAREESVASPANAPPPPPKAAKRSSDLRERGLSKPLYRSPERTQEWAENNWYRLRSDAATAARVAPNRFWYEVATHREGPFLSPHFVQCGGSFSEALCAIALLDIPFVAAAHAVVIEDVRYRVTLASDALAMSTRVEARAIDEDEARAQPLILGQRYLRDDDRFTFERGRARDKHVLGPMLRGVAYVCRASVSNPTSDERTVDLLLQIPKGSMPLQGAPVTRSHRLALAPYGTESIEYGFYFPEAGTFSHAGATASCDERVLAYTGGALLEVRDALDASDDQPWTWLSQHAPLDALVEHLQQGNLQRLSLGRLAWRLRERAAYERILATLEARLHFDEQLWAYALLHRDAPRVRVWLSHHDALLRSAGPALDQGLAPTDPYARRWYEHLEYAPLINARAHRVGAERAILNEGLAAQYQRFIEVIAHRARVTEDDLLSAAHYWFAQDRADEAIALLSRVADNEEHPRMMLDYLRAYGHCVTGELDLAKQRAQRWLDYPVDRWRARWSELSLMIHEALGAAPSRAAAAPEAQAQSMVAHASTEPTLSVAMRAGAIALQHSNLARCELRLYRFDIELLFSQQPFVQGDASRFTWISPAHSRWIELDPSGRTTVALPEDFSRDNLVIVLRAEDLQRTVAHYAHDLAAELSASYGQLRVLRASTQRASVATYVKVFARHRGGEVRFYKDGYTDARGRFDYASLSTTDLDTVERFALLIASDDAGSMVLEAAPPSR